MPALLLCHSLSSHLHWLMLTTHSLPSQKLKIVILAIILKWWPLQIGMLGKSSPYPCIPVLLFSPPFSPKIIEYHLCLTLMFASCFFGSTKSHCLFTALSSHHPQQGGLYLWVLFHSWSAGPGQNAKLAPHSRDTKYKKHDLVIRESAPSLPLN